MLQLDLETIGISDSAKDMEDEEALKICNTTKQYHNGCYSMRQGHEN